MKIQNENFDPTFSVDSIYNFSHGPNNFKKFLQLFKPNPIPLLFKLLLLIVTKGFCKVSINSCFIPTPL